MVNELGGSVYIKLNDASAVLVRGAKGEPTNYARVQVSSKRRSGRYDWQPLLEGQHKAMCNEGGWQSPDGRLLWSIQSHVIDVIGFPRTFGLTRTYVDAVCREYGEPVGQEGKAREKLIQDAVAGHWMRVRGYGRHKPRWSVTVQALDGAARRRTTGFSARLIQEIARGESATWDSESGLSNWLGMLYGCVALQ